MGLQDVIRILRSQFVRLPYPTESFSGQTIIVTGSNTGLGLEAARHFVRLDAAKVIIAVRTISKGKEAASAIAESTKIPDVVDVWPLDLTSYESVKAFAQRVAGLDRLDVVVENAGIMTEEFKLAENNESTITVNVLSTFLLAVLLLPKLRESSLKYHKATVLTLTGSFVHFLTKFPERKYENIFKNLSDPKSARMKGRYNVSKLISLLLVRELASRVTASKNKGAVIVSTLNPGWVKTSIARSGPSPPGTAFLARETEVGSRTIVHAAQGGSETHGQYLSDCKVADVSAFVTSEEGREVQQKLWRELSEILEAIYPGIMQNV